MKTHPVSLRVVAGRGKPARRLHRGWAQGALPGLVPCSTELNTGSLFIHRPRGSYITIRPNSAISAKKLGRRNAL